MKDVRDLVQQFLQTKTGGGFPQVCQIAADAAVGPLAFSGQLLPQAALRKVEQLVLL